MLRSNNTTTMTTPASTTTDPYRDPKVEFDVRSIPGRVKHSQIFQRWLDLPVNEFFVLFNDHDPVPLRYQFEDRSAGGFTWNYLQAGPDLWHVRIAKTQAAVAAGGSDSCCSGGACGG